MSLPFVILVRRSGEIGTKARHTRSRFERRLAQNLADSLRSEGIEASVRTTRDRIFVETRDERAPRVLARLPGVQSVATARHTSAEKLQEVVDSGAALFQERVAGRRFAVRARRVGDRQRIALESQEIERALGRALLPFAAGVDLGDPEVTVRVELHDGSAYLTADEHRGPGGLPLGVEGRALALASGGFDSPVAAWQMLRRGVDLDYLFCNLGGAAHQLGVIRVLKVLADRWSYGTHPLLHAVDFEAVSREIRSRTEQRLWQILLKRQMLRAAERVAGERRAAALITGDAVGQVSSQTLPNLAVISSATALPVLRPLVGTNKEEIIRQAEHIGTAQLSAVVDEYCAMVPTRPATAAVLEQVCAEESKLDPALLERAVAERAVFDLRQLDPADQSIPELEVTAIPAGATVIDLRSRAAYAGWHWPDSLRLDFDRALASYRSFRRDQVFVSYCEFGLKSAHLAECMRAEGFEASHFRGGLTALLDHARERGVTLPDALALGDL